MQICDNLSVSAAPSQLPWKGSQGGAHRRRFSELGGPLSQPDGCQHPYPFCPFGTFPPDRGNRPLEGEPLDEL